MLTNFINSANLYTQVNKIVKCNAFISNSSSSSTDFSRVYVYGRRGGTSSLTNYTSGTPRTVYRGGTAPLPNSLPVTPINEENSRICLTLQYATNPYVVLKGYWIADYQ